MALAIHSLSVVSNTQTKKWLYPTLWFILVVLFLKSTVHKTGHYKAAPARLLANSSISNFVHDITHTESSDLPSGGNQPGVTANVTTSRKSAVIIETRRSASIIPLVLHFSAVLGPEWPVIIYTTQENFGSFMTSQALLRHVKSGRVVIRALAEGLYFPNWDSVSAFLTTPWLWNDLAPADNVLIFQSDSVLCSNSVRSVEDFFVYDLVGAPIIPQLGIGYNGGLSLRNRNTTLRVLDTYDWNGGPEDQWFFARMTDLRGEDEENGITDGILLPTMETARTFAVETIDYPTPLGLHQPTRFLQDKDHAIPLDDWCPEYRLARTDRIQ
ncbi:uncharacterized protein RSE6_08342 [Rhynchosporium secalis]|uniref:DUF5672 domain-containing protein n=1 Tax=Rhynchosporium secalis TaxID=38038 RepID=A0A1E1MF60_RHYSE|nr:uncharacterized protein RSE6_08342 [Rhynchosporium secalis]